MVRECPRWDRTHRCFPHSRGDGPFFSGCSSSIIQFSPLAWGWSVSNKWQPRNNSVFPTRVGMVRPRLLTLIQRPSFPHSRGDGPLLYPVARSVLLFSPLAWGWSVVARMRADGSPVFPTRVGMVRSGCVQDAAVVCFPHSRGDGPRSPVSRNDFSMFSPLAWGWSAQTGGAADPNWVFPTRVGMVRHSSSADSRGRCFPHSRGDGPPNVIEAPTAPSFSPLAWGWSGCESSRGKPAHVFPTRVGMVRDCYGFC